MLVVESSNDANDKAVDRRLRRGDFEDALAICDRCCLPRDRVLQCRWLAEEVSQVGERAVISV